MNEATHQSDDGQTILWQTETLSRHVRRVLLMTTVLLLTGCGSDDNTAQIPDNPIPLPGAPQAVADPDESSDPRFDEPSAPDTDAEPNTNSDE